MSRHEASEERSNEVPISERAEFTSNSKLTFSRSMRWLVTGSAALTIVALGLIIVFLIRESVSFFPEYRKSLIDYRQSGLEYVDLMEKRYNEFIQIDHDLIELRADWIKQSRAENNPFSNYIAEALFQEHRTLSRDLRAYIDEAIHTALGNPNWTRSKSTLEDETPTKGPAPQASLAVYETIQRDLIRESRILLNTPVVFEDPDFIERLAKILDANERFEIELEPHLEQLRQWDPSKPTQRHEAVEAFFFGHEWTTSNEQQDWYGLLPLLSGSLLISIVALILAVPFGVGAALYVNQLASEREQALLKPTIEFISALPAVVIGFFGVMVFGEFIRLLSRHDMLSWIPFFEVQERLNVFTAGCLLALMAIPTIFTIAEDALYAVRNEIKEASYAIGATRVQTALRVVLPCAFPGILSAILLGFGRVIGETMIVLLCAGNRIKIPEFSEGLAAVFDPAHTMTGMIAQEMGEVVYGNIHYQALFMVGLVLFVLSLVINYAAESLGNRHRSAQVKYDTR